MERDRAPLECVRMAPVLADVHYAALVKQSPHPQTRRLFLDSLPSRANLLALVQASDFAALPGVYPPIKNADKLQIVMMEPAEETTRISGSEKARKDLLPVTLTPIRGFRGFGARCGKEVSK